MGKQIPDFIAVALPNGLNPIGGASSPNEPSLEQPGSVGDVALPNTAEPKPTRLRGINNSDIHTPKTGKTLCCKFLQN